MDLAGVSIDGSKLVVHGNKVSVWSAMKVYLNCDKYAETLRKASSKLEQAGLDVLIERVQLVPSDNLQTPMAFATDILKILMCVSNGTSYFEHCLEMMDTIIADSQLIRSGNVAGAAAAANHVLNTVPADVRATIAASSSNPTGAVGAEAALASQDFMTPAAIEHAMALVTKDPDSAGGQMALELLQMHKHATKRKFEEYELAVAREVHVPNMTGITIFPDHPYFKTVMTNRRSAMVYFFAGYLYELLGRCTSEEWMHAEALAYIVGGQNDRNKFDYSEWLIPNQLEWKRPPYECIGQARSKEDSERIEAMKASTYNMAIYCNTKELREWPREVVYPIEVLEPLSKSGRKLMKHNLARLARLRGFRKVLIIDAYGPIGASVMNEWHAFGTYIYLFRLLRLRGLSEEVVRPYLALILRTQLSKLPLKYVEDIFGEGMRDHPLEDGLAYMRISMEEKKHRENMADKRTTILQPLPSTYPSPMALMNEFVDEFHRWDPKVTGELKGVVIRE